MFSSIPHSQPYAPAAYHGPLLVVLFLPVMSTLLIVIIVENQTVNKHFVGYRAELLSHVIVEQWKGRGKKTYLWVLKTFNLSLPEPEATALAS